MFSNRKISYRSALVLTLGMVLTFFIGVSWKKSVSGKSEGYGTPVSAHIGASENMALESKALQRNSGGEWTH